jgi:hypothetical protein
MQLAALVLWASYYGATEVALLVALTTTEVQRRKDKRKNNPSA